MSVNNNLYTMSDADFLNADPSALFAEPQAEALDDSGSELIDEEIDNSEPEVLDEDDDVSENYEEDDSEPELEEADEEELDDDSTDEEEEETPLETEDDESTDTSEPENPESNERINSLLAPLKHHGEDFEIKSDEEARRLMSMGLDYARKTSALKGQRKFLKMLDNNSLLDEAKLNHLIDLSKGDKNAIAKLVQEHGIDTMDLSLEEDQEYTPSNHAVTDGEVELDDVIDSLRGSPSFSDTMSTVGKWDEDSKRDLVKNPNILAVIDEHKTNGIYAMVQSAIDRERLLGNLGGLSDLQAYQAVGDQLYKAGKFNLENQPSNEQPKRVVAKPKAKAEKPELQERRKKLSPPKPSTKSNKGKQEYDFWNMSDEDFEKFNLK